MGSVLIIPNADFSANAIEQLSPLPSGYEMLDWLESNGTQGLLTNYNPKNTTKIVMDVAFTLLNGSSAPNGGIVSTWQTNPQATADRFQINFGNASFYYRMYTWTGNSNADHYLALTSAQTVAGRSNLEVDLSAKTISYQGVTASIYTPMASYSYPLRFLENRQGTIMSTYKAKIYGITIYENGVIVRKYVPVKYGATNGFFDLINDTYLRAENDINFIEPT